MKIGDYVKIKNRDYLALNSYYKIIEAHNQEQTDYMKCYDVQNIVTNQIQTKSYLHNGHFRLATDSELKQINKFLRTKKLKRILWK